MPRLMLKLSVLYNFGQPEQSAYTEGNSKNWSASLLVIIFSASGTKYITCSFNIVTGTSTFFTHL